jgi:hypothetical protein
MLISVFCLGEVGPSTKRSALSLILKVCLSAHFGSDNLFSAVLLENSGQLPRGRLSSFPLAPLSLILNVFVTRLPLTFCSCVLLVRRPCQTSCVTLGTDAHATRRTLTHIFVSAFLGKKLEQLTGGPCPVDSLLTLTVVFGFSFRREVLQPASLHLTDFGGARSFRNGGHTDNGAFYGLPLRFNLHRRGLPVKVDIPCVGLAGYALGPSSESHSNLSLYPVLLRSSVDVQQLWRGQSLLPDGSGDAAGFSVLGVQFRGGGRTKVWSAAAAPCGVLNASS